MRNIALTLGLIATSGFLMAQQPQQQDKSQHLSGFQREALASQSPAVHVHKKAKHQSKNNGYTVTKNKGTIVATVPNGK